MIRNSTSSFRLSLGIACASLIGACSVINAPDEVLPQETSTGTSQGPGGGGPGGGGPGGGGPGGSSACGDGAIDSAAGETCDPPGTCPTTCEDGVACTEDLTEGAAATCNVQCTNTPITACQPDGCCPPGCSGQTDPDCTVCGDGMVEPGETCDGDCPVTCADGNACTTDTMTGSAMDCDVVCSNPPIVDCVQGDGCCPTGCPVAADSDCGNFGRIYMTSSNGSPGFYEYDVAANTWATLPDPPSVTYAQITTDGSSVYLLGADNMIYQYFPPQSQWFPVQQGPGMEASQSIGFLKWTPAGWYFSKDFTTTLHFSPFGAWSTFNLPSQASCAATYEPASGNLYIRIASTLGVMIFSTTSSSVTQQWQSTLSCGENSRTGSFLAGFFYTRDFSGPIQQMNMANGESFDTGVVPSESHTASDVDPSLGRIYFGPYAPTGTTLQMYEPMIGTLTTLAPAPVSVSNHSTIVLVK